MAASPFPLTGALCAWLQALILALGLLTALGASAVAAPLADDYAIETGKGETTFVLNVAEPVAARAFALANPYRVIVDLNEVNFQLGAEAGRQGQGVVSSFRFGLFAPGKSRIVLDVERPVLVTSETVKNAEGGFSLVVRMRETDRATFDAAYNTARQPERRNRTPEPLNHEGISDSGPIVVVIDPGHGGVDPGAISKSGLREKDIVLAVSRRLRDALAAFDNFEVHLTRDRDTFLSLAERVSFARHLKADLFISVHADSIRVQSHSVRGATVYTLSEKASDAEAAALAAKENRADLIAGVEVDVEQNEVADILIDLVRRETKNFSIFFARKLVSEMRDTIRLNSNPHRFAGFHVLKAPDVPSVLVELGYLSNAEDEALMNSPQWQKRFAESAALAIKDYFEVRLAGNGG